MAWWRATDMDSKICLFLLGIISITNGRPANDDSSFLVANESELQSLLRTLYSQGKFDLAFSHHEDGPKTHHEDRAHITHHIDNLEHQPHAETKYSHGYRENPANYKQTSIEQHPSLTNIQTVNLFYKKKPTDSDKPNDNNNNDDTDIETLLGLGKNRNVGRSGSNNVDEILHFLKDIDGNLAGDNRLDDRCVGDRCGRDRDDRNDRDDDPDKTVCIGHSCGRADCKGNRCGRSRDDRDDRNNDNDRADCDGDRCSRGRSGRNDRDDCTGDRCGRNDRDDRDDNDRADCQGDRCSRGRSGRDSNRANCQGDRCSRGRSGRDNDRSDCQNGRCSIGRSGRDDDRSDCRGDRCGRDRNDRDSDRADCQGDRCSRGRSGRDNRDDCQGDRCSRGRSGNDRNDDDRCQGDRCDSSRNGNNRDDDDDRADCKGDRCGRNRNNRDDDDRSECVGNRCSKGRSGNNDRADCTGNRCGRSNNAQDDRDDDDCRGDRCNRDVKGGGDYSVGRSGNNRACIGDRCGRDRDDDDDRNDDNNVLRCFGDGCGRADDKADCAGEACGRDDDDDDNNDDDKVVLRCIGDGCGRDAIDQTDLRERRLPEGDEHIKRQSHAFANKIKLNDEYDAIVLDLSDLEKSLGKSQSQNRGDDSQSTLQLIENVELDNILENSNAAGSFKNSGSSPIEAIVVDLSKSQNDLSKEIKELVSELQAPLKKNKRHRGRSVKSESSKGKSESIILSHNQDNNNVYVPKWLMDEVASKTYLRDISNEQASQKSVLPLTDKQKEKLLKTIASKNNQNLKPLRIFRRSIEKDIGVPFHLEIQGLGQVNP